MPNALHFVELVHVLSEAVALAALAKNLMSSKSVFVIWSSSQRIYFPDSKTQGPRIKHHKTLF